MKFGKYGAFLGMLLAFFMLAISVQNVRPAQGAEVGVLIVNEDFEGFDDFDSLGALEDLLLGKRESFDGIDFAPVRAEEGGYVVFREVVLSMNADEEKSYWLRESFRGEVADVPQKDDDEEVIEFVADNSNPCGLGFVSIKTYEETEADVKALLVMGEDYNSDDYPVKK